MPILVDDIRVQRRTELLAKVCPMQIDLLVQEVVHRNLTRRAPGNAVGTTRPWLLIITEAKLPPLLEALRLPPDLGLVLYLSHPILSGPRVQGV